MTTETEIVNKTVALPTMTPCSGFSAAWCFKISSISITRRRQPIQTNRYLLDITYYFEPIQSFNFLLSVGTFIARVCRNHRGGNQAIKKQLNWGGMLQP